ncbi:Maleylacetate reductase [Methylobacterium crusticola]|uniref:Maleylacetate reductase n=2 Tax=Methylobacterium crusticola TaxID=1697972 RepID=A0ABQ4R0N9_9HYPH|nr:Maleylacetate reductase [Methylobacterium crusticola]
MDAFVYNAAPTRVIFGSGTLAALPGEIERLGRRRALVLSTPHQRGEAEALAAALGGLAAGSFSEAAMHTPVAVTAAAVERVRALGADCTVAVGGGSTTGLGKAVALRTGLDQIVVPTTYAGSEMTPILGQTEDGLKTTERAEAIRPETVIYDVDLTLSLPVALTVTSGMNAIAHAVEALYARDGNPVIGLMAEEGIRAMAGALPRLAADGGDRAARSDALYGAWLCGTCLGAVEMALHHKLCHVLGGSFGLPHAETHCVVLPHATAYNAEAAPDAVARVARALGTRDAAGGLHDLARGLGAPTALAALGLREADLDRAAEIAAARPYPNPRPVARDAIRRLLGEAWQGRRPI